MTIPSRCRDLVIALLDGGWAFVVNRGADTGDNPYITIEGARDGQRIYVTWHTRTASGATGTYRLFSCLLNKRDVTLTKLMDATA